MSNKMQLETANFAPVPSPGELDETYVLPLILAFHRPQNWKYIIYCIAIRGGPGHVQVQKI